MKNWDGRLNVFRLRLTVYDMQAGHLRKTSSRNVTALRIFLKKNLETPPDGGRYATKRLRLG